MLYGHKSECGSKLNFNDYQGSLNWKFLKYLLFAVNGIVVRRGVNVLVYLEFSVFRDLMSRSLIKQHRRFKETCSLHVSKVSTLRIKTKSFSENLTFLPDYTVSNLRRQHSSQSHYDNFKHHLFIYLFIYLCKTRDRHANGLSHCGLTNCGLRPHGATTLNNKMRISSFMAYLTTLLAAQAIYTVELSYSYALLSIENFTYWQ
jgi:hypothetical protein